MKLLGNLKKGLLFVVSAPAGTGKTTLVKMLTDEFPCVKASVSCTTRAPREGEIPGVHYHFISKAEFEKKISDGDFLEYAQVFGDYYGTSREAVLEVQNQGFHVVLVIDTQGAMQIKKIFPAVYIFIAPPYLEVLEQRLKDRNTESPEKMKLRLEWAKKELEMGKQYDYLIVNDELPIAYQILKSIIIAEENRLHEEKNGTKRPAND